MSMIRKLQLAIQRRTSKVARPRPRDGYVGVATRVAIVKFQIRGSMPELPSYLFWDVVNLGAGQFRVELRQETTTGSRLVTSLMSPMVELSPETAISMARTIMRTTQARR